MFIYIPWYVYMKDLHNFLPILSIYDKYVLQRPNTITIPSLKHYKIINLDDLV